MSQIKVEMKELGAAAWSDVTRSCTGVSLTLRKGFTSLGSGCNVSSLSLTLEADSLASAVLFHSTARQVRVSRDGVYIFDGYSEGDASVDSTADISRAWVTLTVKPWSACFETAAADEDLVWEHVKICDPTDKAHSLVHLMVDAVYDNLEEPYRTILASTVDRVTTGVVISKELAFARIEQGDGIIDALSQLLHEYGLAYYMTGVEMVVVEPYDDSPTRVVQEYAYSDFIANPVIRTAPWVVERRCEVTVGQFVEDEDETVYQLAEDGEAAGDDERIEAGASYPADGDLEATYSHPDEGDSLTLYHATDLTWQYLAKAADGVEVSLQVDKAELGGTQAVFRLTNPTGAYCYLNQLTVTAGHVYLRDTSLVVKDATLPKAREAEEVEAYYMVDGSDAERYIQTYRAEVLAEKNTFTLSSARISAPEPGTLMTVGDMPVVMLVRYTEENIATGEVTIYAVAFSVTPIGTTSTVKRPSVSGGVSYLSLFLSGTQYTYDSSGTLDPADQLITARLQRFGTTATPTWYINGEEQDSHELAVNVPATFLDDGRYFITVRVECGDLSAEQYIYRITQGKDGHDVRFQYCYHDSDTVAPLEGGGVWYMLGKPLFYKGRILGDFMSSLWTDFVPEKEAGKPYLWIRSSTDGGATWGDPALISGPPAVTFSIQPSAYTYQLSSRMQVVEAQSITLQAIKENVPGDAVVSWTVIPSDPVETHITPLSGTGDSLTISIAVGATSASIAISCTISDVGTRTLSIVGTKEGAAKPIKLDTVYYPASLPASTSEGGLMAGDYCLYVDANGNILPYIWSGTAWQQATVDSPNYKNAMLGVLTDALTTPGTVPSTSALYAFVGQIVGNAAVFEQVFGEYFEVGAAIYAGDYDKLGHLLSSAKRGFHLSKDGILQALAAILYDIKIRSLDQDGKTVMETHQAIKSGNWNWTGSSPVCWRTSDVDYAADMTIDGITCHKARPASYATSGGTLYGMEVLQVSPPDSTTGTDRHTTATFTAPHAHTYLFYASVWSSDVPSPWHVKVNGATTASGSWSYDGNYGEVLLCEIDVEEGDEVECYMDYCYYVSIKCTCTGYNAFDEDLEDGAAPFAIFHPADLDAEPEVVGWSSDDYCTVGGASVTVPGVAHPVAYTKASNGILTEMMQDFLLGESYDFDPTESTITLGSLTWHPVSLEILSGFATFQTTEGDEVEVGDDHAAYGMSLAILGEITRVVVHRLVVDDEEGSVGTSADPIPNLFAGNVDMQSLRILRTSGLTSTDYVFDGTNQQIRNGYMATASHWTDYVHVTLSGYSSSVYWARMWQTTASSGRITLWCLGLYDVNYNLIDAQDIGWNLQSGLGSNPYSTYDATLATGQDRGTYYAAGFYVSGGFTLVETKTRTKLVFTLPESEDDCDEVGQAYIDGSGFVKVKR